MSTQYALASDDIVSESFDGDFVVVDLKYGKYFSFSDSANVIWEAVTSGVPPQALLREDVAISPVELNAFVDQLVGYGLIATTTSPEPSPVAGFVERLAGAVEKPEVVVFDDLADLFKADPIHDVEEPAGWPVVRQG